VAAENLVLRYAKERGLPAVALCVSNTYGTGDFAPTPHGKQISVAAAGKMPFYIKGWDSEGFAVQDAAAALLLAAEKGRNGERYIISDQMMTAQELYETAADAAGTNPPRFGVPLWVMFVFGCANDAANLVRKRDSALTRTSVRLMHIMPRLDHGKAERELGWRPAPVHQSIRRAAEFYREHRRKLKAA
jgi:dihydroflavonol-4-reductase